MKQHKTKKKPIILITILFLALITVGVIGFYRFPISFGGQYPERPEALATDILLTKEQVMEDQDFAIRFVEDTHPYFVVQKDHAAYEQARQNYINAASGEMSVGDFQAATAEYLCFFEDGHTRIRWSEDEYLDMEQVYQDQNTYRIENGIVSDQFVVEIGGVPIENIYETIDHIFPAENDMARQINRGTYITGRNILELAGVNTQEADGIAESVTVTYSDGSTEECTFYKPEEDLDSEYEPTVNTWQMDGDIFVVNFVECVDDANLKSIADELEKAVKQGCNKVIIDARGNGGGNSNACKRLLGAMGMKGPGYDMLIRFSDEASEQVGYLRDSGTFRWNGSAKCTVNDNVRLVVLCDRYTFSSATMLCVWVRDGKLGTIIGEASSNTPSSYGDILYMSLPNSHILATVSHKQFIRPDENNTERALTPDIQTSPDGAYQSAIDFLNHNEEG
ncbi:MAG: hypothetical protein HDR18_02825 [Lachnospiraceae bacterium]|nr:hypothetical protein [Lachnospiraceae bacterium]